MFVGGTVGTAARVSLTDLLGVRAGLGSPGATLIINLVGCLVLGVLLEALARRGPDVGRRRLLRLGLGTGFCGGFTTYSTLALDVALDLRGSLPWQGIGYAALSLVLGLLVTAAGVLIGSRLPRRRGGAR
ncbi:CrcB protein [Friedmanniella endophytica]|uniref:Fluoride-specific ion channel FluC n=1 Tax=Microlunatus kandeliicorticis TaxID=1759536 RepID=A0A7W3P7C7_9ACTN|nr:CrcB family protein [Microlunatus kandeliicorticis]MBA8795884.1 CrcB protein [Microlunatus kandeliicorticis]